MPPKRSDVNPNLTDDCEHLAEETAHKSRRIVSEFATDEEECRELIEMLGIGLHSDEEE